MCRNRALSFAHVVYVSTEYAEFLDVALPAGLHKGTYNNTVNGDTVGYSTSSVLLRWSRRWC